MLEHATLHEYNVEMQSVSGWRGWYDNTAGECVGFLAMDGKQVAWNAATDTVNIVL